jgi:hypothetical protein
MRLYVGVKMFVNLSGSAWNICQYVILNFLPFFALQYQNEDPVTGPASSNWKAYAMPAPGIVADI